AVSRAGERLAAFRDDIFRLARVDRHDIVLDLNGGTGLLTWEALRHAPDGQVWALAGTPGDAEALAEAAAGLPELQRPVVATRSTMDLRSDLAAAHEGTLPSFDVVLGRDALGWGDARPRSEEHTSELQSRENLVCRLLLEKKKNK